jgi:hypothetical protein
MGHRCKEGGFVTHRINNCLERNALDYFHGLVRLCVQSSFSTNTHDQATSAKAAEAHRFQQAIY